jgi:hypothetical protein
VKKRPEKLGRLVFGPPPERGSAAQVVEERQPRRQPWLWVAGVLMLGASGYLAWASGWLPAQFIPRKVVLRGCELTEPGELSSLVSARPADSYLRWWLASRRIDLAGQRWLTGVQARPLTGRGLLLQVGERKPVLRLESAGAGYWLCDDGSVEKARLEDHQLELFKQIKQFPVVKLEGLSAAQSSRWAAPLMQAAACCNVLLPGQIKTISLSANGELTLVDRGGLQILLGEARDIELRIGALPKALRALSADRSHVAYLDGRGRVQGTKFVFYEVRKGSQS